MTVVDRLTSSAATNSTRRLPNRCAARRLRSGRRRVRGCDSYDVHASGFLVGTKRNSRTVYPRSWSHQHSDQQDRSDHLPAIESDIERTWRASVRVTNGVRLLLTGRSECAHRPRAFQGGRFSRSRDLGVAATGRTDTLEAGASPPPAPAPTAADAAGRANPSHCNADRAPQRTGFRRAPPQLHNYILGVSTWVSARLSIARSQPRMTR